MVFPKFSANTGYLWRDHPFVERIKLSGQNGFDAVEFHDEAQSADLDAVIDALQSHDLPVVSINTVKGNSFGNAAIPGDENSAKRTIDDAAAIADRVDAKAIHVLAGCVKGGEAHKTFTSNLRYALEQTDRMILIEPISNSAVPGYFLQNIQQANSILEEISHSRLKIMFDCFHIRHEFKNLGKIFQEFAKKIGHVQISSFPTRNEPVDGEIEYSNLLFIMKSVGYDGFIGCEYNPRHEIISGLGFRNELKKGFERRSLQYRRDI
ncbi:MAG: TIM barrel protein [Rhizobiaceae bacterium]